ncbi:MAG: plasmid pRiA4b ORF-3 family protein [Chromatiaceae bacterium]
MPSVYQLRAVLRGVSPLIWRRLLVRSDTSIGTLYACLQAAMGWSDIHLHRFRIHGKAYGIARCGGISFVDDPFRVQLSGFRFHQGERFFYEYDFTAGWVVDVRLERILAFDPKGIYPRCMAGRRASPPEDCDGPWAYLSDLDRHDLRRWEVIDRLAEAVEPLVAAGDGRALDEDALREALDGFEAYRRFQPEHFDRKAVNAELRGLATGGGGAA